MDGRGEEYNMRAFSAGLPAHRATVSGVVGGVDGAKAKEKTNPMRRRTIRLVSGPRDAAAVVRAV